MLLTSPVIKAILTFSLSILLAGVSACGGGGGDSAPVVPLQSFQRIAHFPVYLNSQYEHKTSAQMVAATVDGNTLVYTDRALEGIGLVDIRNPAAPAKSVIIPLGAEPTAVVVRGDQLLVTLDTSLDFVNVSGKLVLIDLITRQQQGSIELSGQPDAMALSPDGRFVAIVIENRRDPNLNNGESVQAPAGLLQIVDVSGALAEWASTEVSLTGLAGLLADDPEPVSVDINSNNIAVVTLQKNNHIVLVNLSDGSVLRHFSAGQLDFKQVDLKQDGVIAMSQNQAGVLREPDGVRWLDTERFATADVKGGHGGFTIFDRNGKVLFEPAENFSHIVAQHGHFPERLSATKRLQSESLEFVQYADQALLLVGFERAGALLVYRLSANNRVEFVQLLPSGVSPHGLLALPGRELLVSAASDDDRNQHIRSGLTLYQLQQGAVAYPTIVSGTDADGLPIGFGALSGLAMDALDSSIAYTLADAFYRSSRIFELDISRAPALIRRAIVITDSKGVLVAENVGMVNADDVNSVNIDPEGITRAAAGGFWIAAEGKGDWTGSPAFEYPNYLLRVSSAGVIEQLVKLPDAVAQRQRDAGFEGVASVMDGNVEMLYVAFQGEWDGDTSNFVRIGQYNTLTDAWKFFNYALDRVDPALGGKVGLSDICALSNQELIVIERDNNSGLRAGIKRLYKFSIAGLEAETDDGTKNVHFPELNKVLVVDLLDRLKATGGAVLEKIEGVTLTPDGTLLIVNDNDGVGRSNGETQLLRLKGLL